VLLYIDAAKPKNTIIIIVIVSSPDRHMEPKCTINCRRPEFVPTPLPESPRVPMEFLSRSWSASALEVSKALAPHSSYNNSSSIPEQTSASAPNHNNNPFSEDLSTISSKNQFSFASSATSQLVLERIMSQSAREVLLNVIRSLLVFTYIHTLFLILMSTIWGFEVCFIVDYVTGSVSINFWKIISQQRAFEWWWFLNRNR